MSLENFKKKNNIIRYLLRYLIYHNRNFSFRDVQRFCSLLPVTDSYMMLLVSPHEKSQSSSSILSPETRRPVGLQPMHQYSIADGNITCINLYTRKNSIKTRRPLRRDGLTKSGRRTQIRTAMIKNDIVEANMELTRSKSVRIRRGAIVRIAKAITSQGRDG